MWFFFEPIFCFVRQSVKFSKKIWNEFVKWKLRTQKSESYFNSNFYSILLLHTIKTSEKESITNKSVMLSSDPGFLLSWWQFHQHLTSTFLYKGVLHSFSLITFWLCNFLAQWGQKHLVKCWWNWLMGSISSTFY